MTCALCNRDPSPLGQAPRRCAFEGRTFSQENWMCGTMLSLRGLANYTDRDDFSAGSIGVIRLPDLDDCRGFLVLNWYKERGTTKRAFVVNEDDTCTLTLDVAEAILARADPRRSERSLRDRVLSVVRIFQRHEIDLERKSTAFSASGKSLAAALADERSKIYGEASAAINAALNG